MPTSGPPNAGNRRHNKRTSRNCNPLVVTGHHPTPKGDELILCNSSLPLRCQQGISEEGQGLEPAAGGQGQSQMSEQGCIEHGSRNHHVCAAQCLACFSGKEGLVKAFNTVQQTAVGVDQAPSGQHQPRLLPGLSAKERPYKAPTVTWRREHPPLLCNVGCANLLLSSTNQVICCRLQPIMEAPAVEKGKAYAMGCFCTLLAAGCKSMTYKSC